MRSINRILQTTGMTQQMLADYLGIRRQSLMDAATGRKTLSQPLISKLDRLDFCVLMANLDKAPDLSGYPVYKKESSLKKPCEHNIHHLNDCRYRATTFQKKLDGLEAIKNQTTHLLKALERYEPTDEMEEKWLLMARKDALHQLANFDEDECRALRKRIHLLRAEADYVSNYLKENDFPKSNPTQIQ